VKKVEMGKWAAFFFFGKSPPPLVLPTPIFILISGVYCTNRTGDHLEIRHRCYHCNINFPDATTAMRHTEIWHSRPTGFACPPLTAAQIPEFFGRYDRDNDMCLLCGDLYPPGNWPRRTRHLKRSHGFSRCSHRGGFYREDQFVRHAANVHAVGIELLAGFVEGCKREGMPPAWAAVGKV
jgi:hypothetical protein